MAHGNAKTVGNVLLRVREDKVISHVPLSVVQVISPSDKRVKTDISSVDEDAIMTRLQGIEVVQYRYTPEWQAVRGFGNNIVRGLIAQQVQTVFPEYVTEAPMVFPEKNFSIPDFLEVDKTNPLRRPNPQLCRLASMNAATACCCSALRLFMKTLASLWIISSFQPSRLALRR
jgi:hypothetical protein